MPVFSTNQALRASVVAGNDRRFGERVDLLFLKGGVADPDRENREIVAVLRAGKGDEKPFSGESRSKEWKTPLHAEGGALFVDRDSYPDLVLAPGDRVRAKDRAGAPFFTVRSVDTRSRVRLIAHLGDA